ncbi:Pollen Ole e 1 allergen and extensin family protein [Heracleum sosnowskyi]|uniref:Pollen Ole e 1 allergen and extensin family protein n=1 Tax=Heracleum sosnowskyi TaxID=360622 RepID=A0AAD8M5N0_9APIA|nr:Pollen Ole e 1 allergen and extensin family protein [Heracleum sosnowskyi]
MRRRVPQSMANQKKTQEGIVYCKINITLSPNGTVLGNPPRFSNATVLLQCGNTVVANTTTNEFGAFSIILNPLRFLLQNLLRCNIVVATPLASCNATLPSSATLVSDIIPSTIGSNGLFHMFVPAAFRLVFN